MTLQTETEEKTETMAAADGPPIEDDRPEYLVVRGLELVATIKAHCAGCAIKERNARYPGARLAYFLGDRAERGAECVAVENALLAQDPVGYYMKITGKSREKAERWAQWRKESEESARRLGLR